MAPKTVQVAVRVEPELVELADRIADELAKATLTGLEPTRAAVCREAMGRGLRAMKAELDAKLKGGRRR